MAAFEIARPISAFSVDRRSRQRAPRKINSSHLAWIRTLPSLVPGEGNVEAAHVRYADPLYLKRGTGKGEKPDDKWVVPLCASAHRAQHTMNERQFWRERGIDPLRIALLLYAHSGNDLVGEEIARNPKRFCQ